MKDVLTMQSLTATHYDAPDHILQFVPGDGRKIFVTVRGLGPVDDEFYWDDEDNLARALAEVEEDDIEVQMSTIRALRAVTGMTRKAFSDYFEIPVRTIEDWEAGKRQPPAYVEKLIEYKIEKEGIKMAKMISLDHGNSYLTAAEAMPEITQSGLWETVVDMMDDKTRERVHAEIAPCTDEEFLQRYLELAEDDLVIG